MPIPDSGRTNVWTLVGGAALAGIIATAAFLVSQVEKGDVRALIITLGVMALLGLVLWLAFRASTASERSARLREARDREAEYQRWLAADAGLSALHVRSSWKTWFLLAAVVILFGGIGFVAWGAGKAVAAAVFLGIGGLLAFGHLRNVVRGSVLVIGPDGVHDRRRFGLIPLDVVKGARLAFVEERHGVIPTLWIEVGDAAPFVAAQPRLLRWFNKLDFPPPGMLEIPLRLTDQPPARVLAAMRRLNERVVPPKAVLDSGLSYWVDREFAHIMALTDATLNEAKALEGLPPGAATDAALEAWRRRSEERLAEAEALDARRIGPGGEDERRRAAARAAALKRFWFTLAVPLVVLVLMFVLLRFG